MTAYLEHRLSGIGLGSLESVFIAAAVDTWMFRDVAAEVRALFPHAEVSSPDDEPGSGCDLAIVPFFDGTGPPWRRASLGEALRRSPRHLGFLELRRRRLTVLPRRRLQLFVLRENLLRLGRAGIELRRRMVSGARRRFRRLFSSREPSP